MSAPPVTADFITAINACSYNTAYDCLLNAAGQARFPTSTGGSAWSLGSTGYSLSADAYATLHSATANADGSYTSAAGASYVLTIAAGAAEPTDPPPPK